MAPPTVAEIWRFPIKSMSGESLLTTEVAAFGLVGDRAFAVVDARTRATATAARPRPWGKLLLCRAGYIDEPAAISDLPPVRIEFPDGTTTRSDSGDANRELSAYLGIDVVLERTACGCGDTTGFSASAASDPSFWRQALEPFSDSRQGDGPRSVAGNLAPLHLVTTAALRQIAESPSLRTGLAARLRCNVLIDWPGTGYVENDWVGETMQIGGSIGARVAVVMPTPRCVVPTLPTHLQPERDRRPLDAAAGNRLTLPVLGALPCLGVYAGVVQPGLVSVGDGVVVPM